METAPSIGHGGTYAPVKIRRRSKRTFPSVSSTSDTKDSRSPASYVKLAFALALAMLLVAVPFAIYDDDTSAATDTTDGVLRYAQIDETSVEVIGYTNAELIKNLTIPEVVGLDFGEGEKSYNVTTISAAAFQSRSEIETVDMSAVTIIGDHAFRGCKNLTTVNISSVKSVGDSAFRECKLLTEATMPVVETIGDNAFRYCESLTTVNIPSSTTSIGGTSFNYCTGLESINVDPENETYSSSDGVLYNKDETELLKYPASRVAPESKYKVHQNTKIIGTSAFIESGLTEVDAFNVTSIGEAAFSSCANLVAINIPKVTVINTEAFAGCENLRTVDTSNVEYIGSYAFAECTSLTTMNISKLTSIEDGTFGVCESLAEIIMPNVESIGIDAFYSTGFVTFEISDKIGIIENSVFSECKKLTSITLSGTVTVIGDYAFKGCTLLTDVIMPKVTTIGKSAFKDCGSLAELATPMIETIGDYAFQNCGSLAEVIMSTATTIGNYAFENTGLVAVEIPLSVIQVSDGVFKNCDKLKSMNIHGAVTYIGQDAFFGCASLQSIYVDPLNTAYLSDENVLFTKDKVTLLQYPSSRPGETYTVPELTTEIGTRAFEDCKFLKTVDVRNVKTIGNDAFRNSELLAEISMPAVEYIGTYAFMNTGFVTIELPIKITTVNQGMFSECKNLGSITSLSPITLIDSYAFFGCVSFTTIDLLNVTKIDISAFQDCTSLKTVTLFKTTVFGSYAFRNTGLETIEIPEDSSSSITHGMFEGCTELRSVVLHRGNFIYPYAFKDCVNLETITLNTRLSECNPIASFEGCNNLKTVILGYTDDTFGGRLSEILKEWKFPGMETEFDTLVIDLKKNNTLSSTKSLVLPTLAGSSGKVISIETILDLDIGENRFCADANSSPMEPSALEGRSFSYDPISEKWVPSVYTITVTEESNVSRVGDGDATDGTETTITIKPAEHHSLPSGIEICVGNKSLELETDYDYDPSTGVIVIVGSAVRGDIEIIAVGDINQYSVSVSAKELNEKDGSGTAEIVDKSNPATVDALTSLTLKATPNTGFVFTRWMTTEGAFISSDKEHTIRSVEESAEYVAMFVEIGTEFVSPELEFKIIDEGEAMVTGCDITEPTTLEIPEIVEYKGSEFSVTSIGNDAFRGCISLKEVTMPAVTTIGNNAFHECSLLETVTMPLVKTIGEWAFYSCGSLTTIDIPANTTTIGALAFYGCTSLESITVNEGNQFFFSDGEVLYDKEKKTLIAYPTGKTSEEYTVLNGVEVINDCAFENQKSLKTVIMPSVKSIGATAFANCTSLMTMTLDSVTSIGEGAFANCTSLSTVTLDSVTSIGEGAFDNTSINTVVLKSSETTPTTINDFIKAWKLPGATTEYNKLVIDSSSPLTLPNDISISSGKTISFSSISKNINIGNNTFYESPSGTEVTTVEGRTFVYDVSGRWVLSMYTITITGDNISWIGENNVAKDTEVVVTIIADENHVLPPKITVTVDGTEITSGYTYVQSTGVVTIPGTLVKGPVGIIANAIRQYTISVTPMEANGISDSGSATINGNPASSVTVEIGTTVTLEAVPSEGFVFLKWMKDGMFLSSDREYPAGTVSEDASYVAVFVKLETEFDGEEMKFKIIAEGEVEVFDYTGTATELVLGTVEYKDVPFSVTAIGNEAFKDCTTIETVNMDNVTTIGEYAFSGSGLKTVTIPATVSVIGISAFESCSDLVSVNILGKTLISESAFFNCGKLASLEMSNVESIRENAFAMTGMVNVMIPKSVKSIGDGAFAACADMISFTVDEESTAYRADEHGVLYAKSNAIVAYPAGNDADRYEVEDGTVIITATTFYGCTNLRSVILPESITTIGEMAFLGCTNLENITIPAAASIIGSKAFLGCSGLTTLILTSSGAQMSDDMTESIASWKFIGMDTEYDTLVIDTSSPIELPEITKTAGKTIVFDENSKSIVVGDNEFFDAGDTDNKITDPAKLAGKTFVHDGGKWVSTVSYEIKITEGGNVSRTDGTGDAVEGAGKTIVIAADTGYILPLEITVKVGTKKLTMETEYTYDDDTGTIVIVKDEVIGNIEITAIAIRQYTISVAFEEVNGKLNSGSAKIDGTNETSVTVNEGTEVTLIATPSDGFVFLKWMKGGVFVSSDKIEVIEFANETVQYVAVFAKIGTLFETETLKFKIIAEGEAEVTGYIGTPTDLDIGTVKYKDATLSVTAVSNNAFNGHTGLKSIIMPNVTTIGDDAFNNCYSLTTVEMPNVKTIGGKAFYSCSDLVNVTIPASTTEIGDFAFNRCNSLTSITVDEDNTKFTDLEGVLFDKAGTLLITYPIGKTAQDYVVPVGVTTIGAGAFESGKNIKTVNTSNVTVISNYAFTWCENLTTLNILKVTSIGNQVFRNCTSLTTMDMPKVTSIGDDAFNNCYSLTTVEMPNVKTIGDKAFYSCSDLVNVTIPASTTEIGDFAFNRCNSLTSITVDEDNTKFTDLEGVLFDKAGTLLITYPIGKTAQDYVVPVGVTTIGAGAFEGCPDIETVTISIEVSIGDDAFSGCSGITTVILISGGDISSTVSSSIASWKLIGMETEYNTLDIDTEEEFELPTIGKLNGKEIYFSPTSKNVIAGGNEFFDAADLNTPLTSAQLSDKTFAIVSDKWVSTVMFTITITENGNVARTDGGSDAVKGVETTVTIQPTIEDYVLPETITVKVGAETLVRDAGYTYDKTTGNIVIDGSKVIDNIEITAVATQRETPGPEDNTMLYVAGGAIIAVIALIGAVFFLRRP